MSKKGGFYMSAIENIYPLCDLLENTKSIKNIWS